METALFYVSSRNRPSRIRNCFFKCIAISQKGLHEVLRHKSKRVSQKIPLPQETREFLDIYLEKRAHELDEPLFVTRYGTRLQTLDVYRICQRVLKQALVQLKEHEKFEFTPHKLRHTFLKKVTDKHGVHFAQELSGNVSIKEIFRYAKPSQDEMQETIEDLFV